MNPFIAPREEEMAAFKFYLGLVIAALGLLVTAGCGAGGAGLFVP